ncbi:MAG: hypothetical protein A3C90_01685 [Candidatus Magasanikbacteria bacterium RIFCSPHIGHO2_02_FULL_51_14]|uniref:Uncharacterized protein n=1 Tax=Candidatus Magasanikbacteria bacterium RIFCSPHIGHO2_02_FULL_51_14 TaxID=1798683 RepID=A0A1F6MQN8_9BACT|nr:MAG: hypothetical protein A3C90_01685 [Candidatus Magasanikbacteria bacterium RIFCSPHIGHO2_02_FULL_51_14]
MLEVSDKTMPNGERRFYRMHDDGSGYVRTETTVGGWQNSHFHEGIREWYAVQRGWMAYAELVKTAMGTTLRVRICHEGGHFVTESGIAHNVYLPADTAIHTVKFGKTGNGPDWHASPELDGLTKQLTEEDIHRLAGG